MRALYKQWLAEGTSRRWIVVAGSILINLGLGVLYAWSVLHSALQAEFHWSAVMSNGPFTLAIVVFTITMTPAGRWSDRRGPKFVGLASALLIGMAFALSSLAPKGLANSGPAWVWLMLTFGVLAGAAMGLGYAATVVTAMLWFPDKRGLVVGLTVMGFGCSALIFGPLANSMILENGVRDTFFCLGIALASIVAAGSLLLTSPPRSWHPAGCESAFCIAAAEDAARERDFSPRELLCMPQTYMLITALAFAASAGLMVISFAKAYLDSFDFDALASAQGLAWISRVPIVGYNPFTGKEAQLSAGLVGWLALWNGVGRAIFGWVSDRIGRREAMLLDHLAIFIAALATPFLTGSAWSMVLMYLLIGLSYGGNLSLFPSLSTDWFGTKHAGVNYGIIFTGWGLAGIIGPLMGSIGAQSSGGYLAAFGVAAILGLVAAIMSFTIRRPAAGPK